MATTLAALGTATYNTISFGVLSNSKLTMRNIYDDAGRTVKYVDWLLRIDGFITQAMYAAGTTTDTDIDAIKAKLMQPGGALTLTTRGLGAISINNGSVRDVLWGPQPHLIELQSAGGNQALMFSWTLQWRAPVCPSGAAYQHRLMSYNFAVDFSINLGLTVRTIRGSYEVPITRVTAGSRRVPDTADDPSYREAVYASFPPIPGFLRERSDFSISTNKSRCEVTIVDTEIGSQNPLPDGTTNMDIEHSLSSHGRGILAEWTWRLSGSVTMAPTMPTSLAWSKFLIVLKERLLQTVHGPLRPNVEPVKVAMLPIEMEFREQIFGLTSHFSVAFILVVPPGQGNLVPQNILTATGLWTRIEGTNWLSWLGSLRNDVTNARGQAGLSLKPSDDIIVDLCLGDSRPPVTGGVYKQPQLNLPKTPLGKPDAAGLWLWYQNRVRAILKHGEYLHWPLKSGEKAIVHKVREGDIILYVMEGWALRLKWPTPIPSLKSINGKTPVQIGSAEVTNYVAKVWAGLPVVYTSWRVLYMLPEEVPSTKPGDAFPKETQTVPANPRMGTPDGGMSQRQIGITESPGYQLNPAAFPPLDK